MKEFYRLNKIKLLKSYIFIAIIGFIFVSILLLISYLTNKFPNLELVLYIYLTAIFIFPLFAIFMAFLDWTTNKYLKNKWFNKKPLVDLDKLGFINEIYNANNKWYFTEIIKKGIINDFKIECNIKRNSPKYVEFSTNVSVNHLTDTDIERIINELKEKKLFDELEGIRLKIKIDKLNTIDELKETLTDFVNTLKTYNL